MKIIHLADHLSKMEMLDETRGYKNVALMSQQKAGPAVLRIDEDRDALDGTDGAYFVSPGVCNWSFKKGPTIAVYPLVEVHINEGPGWLMLSKNSLGRMFVSFGVHIQGTSFSAYHTEPTEERASIDVCDFYASNIEYRHKAVAEHLEKVEHIWNKWQQAALDEMLLVKKLLKGAEA